MKKISKLVLVIFSVIILIIGVGINLLIAKWVSYETAFSLIEKMLTSSPTNKVVLIITEFCMLFAILCIFMDSSDWKNSGRKRDILMQNDNGRLMISRDTIETLVNSAVKEFPGAKETNTKIQLDVENNVAVLVDITVTKDVVIKELTLNLQNKIKETIKKTTDLEVNEVNVRIKNVVDNNIEE